MVGSEDAVEILSWAECLGIEVRLDGGWGVDALLGRRTRDHNDIDLFIEISAGPDFTRFLSRKGFREVEREFTTPSHTVWEDGRGRVVDLHLYELGADGSYRFEGASYPAETFGAVGRIAGKSVRCIPAELQVFFHRGYDFDETDLRDVLLLCEHFGISVPEEYADFEKTLHADKELKIREMKIGFIGFGNMASALADGLVRTGALQPARIGACARDWEKLRRNTEPKGYVPLRDAAAVAEFADLVFVAVKPHQVEAVLGPVKEALRKKIVVSVVAGYTFEKYERILAAGTPHLSTIPNTPVSVGEGVIVCERRHSLGETDFARVTELLGKIGLVLPVETESMDISGTICGCGPAFVCLFMEALADAAVKYGIARADAYHMVGQMVAGTGKLLLESGLHPAQLKDAVCSPAGTTIVGVAELERQRFRGAVIDAVDAIERKE